MSYLQVHLPREQRARHQTMCSVYQPQVLCTTHQSIYCSSLSQSKLSHASKPDVNYRYRNPQESLTVSHPNTTNGAADEMKLRDTVKRPPNDDEIREGITPERTSRKGMRYADKLVEGPSSDREGSPIPESKSKTKKVSAKVERRPASTAREGQMTKSLQNKLTLDPSRRAGNRAPKLQDFNAHSNPSPSPRTGSLTAPLNVNESRPVRPPIPAHTGSHPTFSDPYGPKITMADIEIPSSPQMYFVRPVARSIFKPPGTFISDDGIPWFDLADNSRSAGNDDTTNWDSVENQQALFELSMEESSEENDIASMRVSTRWFPFSS